MSVEEYDLWAREYRTHPWGERFITGYLAQIPYVIANYSGKTLQKGKEAPFEGFILNFDPDAKQEQTAPDPFAFFAAMKK
jgi:hypothetical protein